MDISEGTGLSTLAIAIFIAALAAAPSLTTSILAQNESASTTIAAQAGPANSILISSSGKNYFDILPEIFQ
jgi:hypothetical protein